MRHLIAEEGNYVLRRMEDTAGDYALLSSWLTDERVLAFYEGRDTPFGVEKIKEKYAPRILSEEGVTPCIMEYEGRPIGYLQFYRANADDYQFEEHTGVFALDLFIGFPDLWGRGHGSQFIRLLLEYLFEDRGARWVLIDPHTDNARAIRAYEKCGFRKRKLLREHEFHEGKMIDCWLMEIRWDQFR